MTATTQTGLSCTVTRTGRITWLCDECGQPIKAKTGYLTVDWGEAMQQYWDAEKRDRQRWNAAEAEGHPGFVIINGRELVNLPRRVRWQVLHRGCDQQPERDDYWVAVERADTLARLLDWTAHLMEKNWLPETNWHSLLRTVAAAAKGADA